jgi:mannose-1-phosphate guanylyltransferase
MATSRLAGLWSLVLAGGDGMRLRSLTQRIMGMPVPKQYCRLLDNGRSLLETTLARVRALTPPARTLTIITRHHLPFAEEHLTGVPRINVLVQPQNRDTGPGLLYSLLRLARRQPEAMVAVFPSDHYVRDETTFRAHVRRAARIVARVPDTIALLGIAPTEADDGLGYIEPGAPLVLRGAGPAFHVARFWEKPSAPEAQTIVDAGGLWNSFVMVFRVGCVLELLARVRAEDVLRMRACEAEPGADYTTLPPWNFSRDFLAHVPERLVVVRADGIGWSDWGTPEAIARTFATLEREPPWPLALAAGSAAA